jgi:hypothetical protein
MTQPDNCFDLQLLCVKLYANDTNKKSPGSTGTVLLYIHSQWRYHTHQWRYHNLISGVITHIISGIITYLWRYDTLSVALSLTCISGVMTHHQWRYHISVVLSHIISGFITNQWRSDTSSMVLSHTQWRYDT